MTKNTEAKHAANIRLLALKKEEALEYLNVTDWQQRAAKEIQERKDLIYNELRSHTHAELLEILEIIFNRTFPTDSTTNSLMNIFTGQELESILKGELDIHETLHGVGFKG